MTNNEKKFWSILTELFVGAEVKGRSGFINLMIAKQSYFKKVKKELLEQINDICKDNNAFKDELYDKLYSFFHRYFSQSGSIYYNYTPLFYNVYTKEYDDCESKNFCSDYEQVISNKQDTSLFYKTKMLYYVKSDKIFKDLEVQIEDKKFIFDVSNMQGKKANEKKSLVYELKAIENKTLVFNVIYSQRGKITKMQNLIKEAKKSNITLSEEDLKKAFKVFEKQSNVDYFINKDAQKFLSEQLDMWIYQYMFSQEVDFDMDRFNQIKDFKKVASKLINFISQFENELAKVWNKPRFVLNSNIVVSIDKLISKGFDIEKLKNHPNFKDQQQEWESLGINQNDGLMQNEFLPIDTKYFSDLKSEIEELFNEDEIDGLLIKSENYQALNTIEPRFKGKVDLIYIDPPFNTGDDFAYIDRFQDSTWLSLMENRLSLAKEILSKQGSFYLHLDHNASYLGRILLNNIFGKDNFRNEIVWSYRSGGASKKESIPRKHDNIFLYAKNENFQVTPLYERQYYEVNFMGGCSQDENGKFYVNTLLRDVLEGEINIEIENNIKRFNIKPVLNLSSEHIGFGTQKPEGLLHLLMMIASSNPNSIILDYHLGSGTTVATAQKLKRKYIGIEMGEHFYSVVIPRMKKVLSGFQSGISKDIAGGGGGRNFQVL